MEYLVNFGPLGAFAILIVLDLVKPARRFPAVRRWRAKGLAFFVLYLMIAMGVPMLIDGHLAPYRLLDATSLGVGIGTVIAILAQQLVSYGWHRALHRVPLLWRWFHQMHHSAERVDVFGAFYFHPFDMVGFVAVGSVALVLGVGVPGESAAIANLIVTLASLLGHANIRTPRWLGYIVQRPENHAVHHQRGVHAFNYGDIALWDMVFGTWKNPERWEAEAGFYDGASQRVGAMLLGRDVAEDGAPPSAQLQPAGSSDARPLTELAA